MYTNVYMCARMRDIKSHIGLLFASNQNDPRIRWTI
jgi:hypothetical protein